MKQGERWLPAQDGGYRAVHVKEWPRPQGGLSVCFLPPVYPLKLNARACQVVRLSVRRHSVAYQFCQPVVE
jgi:hypothetical protein